MFSQPKHILDTLVIDRWVLNLCVRFLPLVTSACANCAFRCNANLRNIYLLTANEIDLQLFDQIFLQ